MPARRGGWHREGPPDFEALLAQATDTERRVLQELLNRTVELHLDPNVRKHRFTFTEPPDPEPSCPACRDPVHPDEPKPICCICIVGPAPDGLLDALRLDALLTERYEVLTAALRGRAAVEVCPAEAAECEDRVGPAGASAPCRPVSSASATIAASEGRSRRDRSACSLTHPEQLGRPTTPSNPRSSSAAESVGHSQTSRRPAADGPARVEASNG